MAVKNTDPKTKPLISKENAQNRPETIQWETVLGVSAFREQIGNSAVKRRCLLCPVCRNTSRKNGRSFLMSVAGRNITSFAENAKGAASRASVPPLFTAHTIYRKGEQDNDRLSEQHSRKAGNHQGKRYFSAFTRKTKNPRGLLLCKRPRGCCFILPLRFFLFGLRLPLLALQDKGCGENLHRQSPFSYIFRGFAFSYTWGSAASMIQYVTAEPHL